MCKLCPTDTISICHQSAAYICRIRIWVCEDKIFPMNWWKLLLLFYLFPLPHAFMIVWWLYNNNQTVTETSCDCCVLNHRQQVSWFESSHDVIYGWSFKCHFVSWLMWFWLSLEANCFIFYKKLVCFPCRLTETRS